MLPPKTSVKWRRLGRNGDEGGASRQYRRPAPAGKAAPAENRFRLHRGRHRGRARPRTQHLGLSKAPAAAALSRRRLGARPVSDDFWTEIFKSVRDLAD